MLMGIVAVVAVLFAGVFAVMRRKSEASSFGEAGAHAVKLGRLY